MAWGGGGGGNGEEAGIQYMSLTLVVLCDFCTEWLNEGMLQDIADLKKSVGSLAATQLDLKGKLESLSRGDNKILPKCLTMSKR